MLFGYTKEYVINNITWRQLLIMYKYGVKFDYIRRGWKFDNKAEEKEELVDLYYTDEEKKEREKYLKKLYGKDIKGL